MTVRCFALLSVLLATGVAHAKDPRAVRLTADALDRYEKKLNEGDLQYISTDAWSLYDRFRDAGDDFKSDPAFPGLVKRWRDLTAKTAAIAGGHSKEILGDGSVPEGDDRDRAQLYDEVEGACRAAADTRPMSSDSDIKELKAAYAKYEKALARALRVDPTSVRHKNGHFKLFACEWKVPYVLMNLEDNVKHDFGKTEHYKTCGYDEYVLRRLKMGGKWGPWEVDGVPGSNGYPLDCKKHPKATKLSGNMPALVKQEFKYPRSAVWTISGQPTTAQDGLHIYQYQSIRVYGNDITVATSACGDTDKKIVCAASGAKLVQSYNAVAHLSARAEVHRDAGRVDRCKSLYQKARVEAAGILGEYETASKSSDWDKTLKYKTRNDGTLTEAKLIARLTELSEQADERSVGRYCQK